MSDTEKGPLLDQGLATPPPNFQRESRAAGLTVSRHRRVLWGLLTQRFCGSFQLLLQPADVTVGLCPHNAEFCVDIFVLVTGVLLVLGDKRIAESSYRQAGLGMPPEAEEAGGAHLAEAETRHKVQGAWQGPRSVQTGAALILRTPLCFRLENPVLATQVSLPPGAATGNDRALGPWAPPGGGQDWPSLVSAASAREHS